MIACAYPAHAEPGAALARVADLLAWPLFLLSPDAVLRHANHAARQLLRAGQPLLLLLLQRRLQPAAAPHRAAFCAALQAAAAGQPAALRWPGRPGGFRATLQLLSRLPGGSPVLLLALTAPSRLKPDVQAWAQAQGLTAAQARILDLLAQGLDARQTAARLGLAPSTARGHIASLRRKTGHASVTELLQCLHRLPPVLTPQVPGGDGK